MVICYVRKIWNVCCVCVFFQRDLDRATPPIVSEWKGYCSFLLPIVLSMAHWMRCTMGSFDSRKNEIMQQCPLSGTVTWCPPPFFLITIIAELGTILTSKMFRISRYFVVFSSLIPISFWKKNETRVFLDYGQFCISFHAHTNNDLLKKEEQAQKKGG